MSADTKNEMYLSREESDLCGLSKIILEKNKDKVLWIYQNPKTMCYLIQDNKYSIKCQNVGKDIEPYLSSYKTDGYKVKLDRR
jgi:hypothetical protein